jgi:hypothetical protein
MTIVVSSITADNDLIQTDTNNLFAKHFAADALPGTGTYFIMGHNIAKFLGVWERLQ